jgi:hypothetical protein
MLSFNLCAAQHQKILDLNERILIAIDVAIALTYLHLSAGMKVIIHGDNNGSVHIH